MRRQPRSARPPLTQERSRVARLPLLVNDARWLHSHPWPSMMGTPARPVPSPLRYRPLLAVPLPRPSMPLHDGDMATPWHHCLRRAPAAHPGPPLFFEPKLPHPSLFTSLAQEPSPSLTCAQAHLRHHHGRRHHLSHRGALPSGPPPPEQAP